MQGPTALVPIFRTLTAGPNSHGPSVGIIILNYNGLTDTLRCIESLRAVAYAPMRVYLIDNASNNGEGQTLAACFDDVTVIVNSRNVGFGGACNQGAQAALDDGAQYLLFLNNDTVVQPTMLRDMVNEMKTDARIGLCGPRVLSTSPPHRIQCLGYRYSNWIGIPAIVGKDAAADAKVRYKSLSWIMGCALLVSRDLWLTSGGFDTDFFLYWEDVYLCWQARRLGYLLKIAESATVFHRKTVGSEFSRRHVYHMLYGQIRFSLKTATWYQWPSLSVGLSLVAAAYAVLAYRRWRINVLPLLCEAIGDAFHNSPKRFAEI